MNTLKAYDILMQRLIEESRLMTERTSLFLVACSFLFVAFVSTEIKEVRIAVGSFGVVLSIAFYFLNQAAVNAIHFWLEAQRQLEEDPEFDYMRCRDILPFRDGAKCAGGQKEPSMWEGKWQLADISKWRFWRKVPGPTIGLIFRLVPPLFLALWVFAIVSIWCFPSA